jgi:hypothetical protein
MTTSPTLPDLTLFTVLHRGFRTDARRLADAVAGLAPVDARRQQALTSWYGRYRTAVHEHHTHEDGLFFPALLERVPVFDRHLGRIESDHDRLSEVVDAVAVSLDHLGGAAAAGRWGAAHSEATALTAELRDSMAAHLAFEDADVLPLFVRHFGAAEYEELGERAMKDTAFAQLTFTIPWAMSHGLDEERRTMLAGAPFAFRLLWIATRGHHDRAVAAALGQRTRPVVDDVVPPVTQEVH